MRTVVYHPKVPAEVREFLDHYDSNHLLSSPQSIRCFPMGSTFRVLPFEQHRRQTIQELREPLQKSRKLMDLYMLNYGMHFVAVRLFIPGSMSGTPNGALTVTNWNSTTTSLTFNINGTLHQDFAGTRDQLDIFIGEPYKSNWINSGGVDVTNPAVFWGLNGSRWLQPKLQVGTVIPEPSSAFIM